MNQEITDSEEVLKYLTELVEAKNKVINKTMIAFDKYFKDVINVYDIKAVFNISKSNLGIIDLSRVTGKIVKSANLFYILDKDQFLDMYNNKINTPEQLADYIFRKLF